MLKPNLIIITNRLIVGGISNDIIPLAYYLKQEFNILILHGEKENEEAFATFLTKKYPGLQFHKIKQFKKTINPVTDLLAYFQVKKIIKAFKADIVHTHGAKSGFLGRIAAHNSKVSGIIHTFHGHHFHSYYNSFFNSNLLRLERMLGRITTIVVSISISQKKELAEVYKIIPAEKIRTIHLGIEFGNIDPEKQRRVFRKKYKIDDDVIIIGIAGRIVPVKNLNLFVQVAKRLMVATLRKLCFFIIGDGFLKKQIIKQCEVLGMSYTETEGEQGNVIFTSWIEDVIPAMNAMDIVALTSNNEGTPMSLIEAQFCGKPVVATNVGGIQDSVINNKTGFLVEAGDADAMSAKLKLLIENDALRKTMGENAAIFAAANFSKHTEVENYKQLYKQLLAQNDIKYSKHQHLVVK